MMVRLIVDLNSCIGSAECVALDPGAIELDNDGLARPLLPELEEHRAQQICDMCPIGALSTESI